MWICKKCNTKFEDDDMEFCFECLELRKPAISVESSARIGRTVQEGSHRILAPPRKPAYLVFLRLFGAIQCLIGIIALLLVVIKVFGSTIGNDSTSFFMLLLAVGVAIEGFLAYGLLFAIADITENMILVGWFIKKTDSKQK